MVQNLQPVLSDTEQPAAVDVVVIGGGIMGVCTAWNLVRAGVSVLLCEKGVIGGEQSSRNWGWVRKMGRDHREMPLMLRAMDIWAGLNDAIDGETGFRVTGITYFAGGASDIEKYRGWLARISEFDLDTRVLSSEEAAHHAPGATRRFYGALHTASDGMAEPTLATSAIASAARRAGCVILQHCAARTVEMQGGKVAGVVTERGRVACKRVVLAAGGWSSLFLGNLGLRFPQLKILSQVMRSAPIETGLVGCGSGPGFGFRKRLDGGYNMSMRTGYPVDVVPDSFRFFKDFRPSLFSEHSSLKLRLGKRSLEEFVMRRRWRGDQGTPFEKYRVYDPAPGRHVLEGARKSFDEIFPAFRGARIVESWGGLLDATPDAIPVISGIDSHPGLFVSAGYSGHGFGLGPAAGQLMAELVQGTKPCVDPAPFRFGRFSDGTKIQYWPIGF